MTASWPVVALIGLLGLAIGSFLNVVIYRVPRDESILFPASHCPNCDTEIKPRHNVPVFSWLWLKGKCAYCREPISARYPLVEAGTATLFVAITLEFDLSLQLPAYLYLAAVGITLAMIDFDMRRLPDTIVLPSYVVSLLLLMPAGAVDADWTQSGRALAGMVALLTIYFALAVAYPTMISFGDVKVAGLAGLYLGWLSWSAVFLGVLLGFALAGFGGTAAIVTNRASTRPAAVPLGLCVITASVIALFAAAPLTAWYGSLLTLT
jgi:leader peptidase (prepilin peptidase) / N-methyltransferase